MEEERDKKGQGQVKHSMGEWREGGPMASIMAPSSYDPNLDHHADCGLGPCMATPAPGSPWEQEPGMRSPAKSQGDTTSLEGQGGALELGLGIEAEA